MSRFKKLSHVIWCCKYLIVWVPKYRFKILTGAIAQELYKKIPVDCGRLGCKVEELNIQKDHVHLMVSVPPKVSISSVLGSLKGKTAIQIFRQFPYLKSRPYWGNHFWARDYFCVTSG